jgi:hypothetical protein
MWQHQCPWVLTYWCGVKVNQFAKVITIPFRAYFYLSLKEGRLYYQGEISDGMNIVARIPETRTVVTIQGIIDYYELIDEMINRKSFGHNVPFIFVGPTGSPGKWDHTRYCTACKAASYTDDWDEFLDKAKEEYGCI